MRRWKRAEKKRAEETDGLVGRTVPLLSFFNGSQAVLPVGWVVGWPAGLWGGKGRGWKRGYQNEGVVFSFFFSRCGHRDKAGRQAGRQTGPLRTNQSSSLLFPFLRPFSLRSSMALAGWPGNSFSDFFFGSCIASTFFFSMICFSHFFFFFFCSCFFPPVIFFLFFFFLRFYALTDSTLL